jgi:predicted acetyltransferase
VPDLVIRSLRPHEIERFVRTSHYAFHGRSPAQRRLDFAGRVTPDRNILVAFEGDEIVAQVMIYEFGVWLDGVSYPTGGLANVVTAPEVTRRGYASQMLRATLRWMRDELGQCLSTLYPTVFPLYRGLGWALADDTQRISGPPAAFRPAAGLPSEPGARLVRRIARPEDEDLLAPVYECFARERAGYLDRPRWWWEPRVLRFTQDEPSWVGLWYGANGDLGGYVVYWFNGPHSQQLVVHEAIALRPEAYHDLLRFLAAHNLASEIALTAGRDVPWRSLVANPHQLRVHVDDVENFMLRIVDFPAAISRRAAAAHADAASGSLHLKIVDESAPWNQGTWRLSIDGGRWKAQPDPDARPNASADISTIAALFGGFLTVDDATSTGLLQVDDRARPTLEALFRTRFPPASFDHF